MKQFLKNISNFILGSKIVYVPFNVVFANRVTIKIFIFIYENSPHIVHEILTRMIKQPSYNFTYKIKLLNAQRVKIPIDKNYKPSFELALSYKWHDRGLRDVEKFLNDFYPIEDYYLDIGSNHGLRSLYSLSIKRPVILFEPNPSLNPFVYKLFSVNNYSGFKIENICLSDRKGKATFYISGSSYCSSLDLEQAQSDELVAGIEEIEVELMNLDSYYETNISNKKVSIIKIDVEGHEYPVLRGSEKMLLKNRPTLMIEILPSNEQSVDLFKFLSNMGYRSFGILNKGNLKVTETSNTISKVNNYIFTADESVISNLKK